MDIYVLFPWLNFFFFLMNYFVGGQGSCWEFTFLLMEEQQKEQQKKTFE